MSGSLRALLLVLLLFLMIFILGQKPIGSEKLYIQIPMIEGPAGDGQWSGWIRCRSASHSLILIPSISSLAANEEERKRLDGLALAEARCMGQRFVITKVIDNCSPQLDQSMAEGREFPCVELAVCDENDVCLCTITLEQVTVQNIRTRNGKEQVTLSFHSLRVEAN